MRQPLSRGEVSRGRPPLHRSWDDAPRPPRYGEESVTVDGGNHGAHEREDVELGRAGGVRRAKGGGRATNDGKERRRRRQPTNYTQNMFVVVITLLIAYEIFHSVTSFIGTSSWNYATRLEPETAASATTSSARSAEEIASQNQALAAAYGKGKTREKSRMGGAQWSASSSPFHANNAAALASNVHRDQHVVWSWFEQASTALSQGSTALSQSLSNTAGAASSVASAAWAEAARYAEEMGITAGLVQLPTLVVPASVAGNDTESDAAPTVPVRDSAPGASWSSSAWGALTELPAYLKAVAMHAAPQWTAEEAMAQLEERGSIFSARRKGDWMGCTRPYHLICKGVYRAIKRVDAVTVLDTACLLNAHWLPLVIQHLRKEFRYIKLVCAVEDKRRLQYVRAAFENVENVRYEVMDPFRDSIENKTDLVIAIKLLDKRSMIHAMRFFRNIQRNARTVSHVVYENFPTSLNRRDVNTDKLLPVRLNTFLPPFMFGKSLYRYENVDESPTAEVMEIVTMETGELFANKQTPAMADLEDPKLKKRRQDPKR